MSFVNRVRDLFDQVSDHLPCRTLPTAVVWSGVTIGGLIALAEVDRMIGRAVSAGENSTVATIVGPGSIGARDRWDDWTEAVGAPTTPDPGVLSRLIGWHIVFDVIFFVGYGMLLWRLIDVTFDAHPPRRLGGYVAKACLSVLLLAEVVEAGFLAACAALVQRGVGDVLPWPLAVAALVKWLALVALLVTAVRDESVRVATVRAVRNFARPVWVQRLSLVVVVLLVALTLIPLPGALDQIPDAARRWISSGAEGYLHLALAAIVYVLTALGLFTVGRRRWDHAVRRWVDGRSDRPEAVVWPWILVPGGVAAAAVVLNLTGHDDLVDPFVVGLFIAIPWTVAAATLAVRRTAEGTELPTPKMLGSIGLVALLFAAMLVIVWGDPGRWWLMIAPLTAVAVTALAANIIKAASGMDYSADTAPPTDPAMAERVRRVGDALALSVLIAGAAAYVRTFAAPFSLAAANGRGENLASTIGLATGWALFIVIGLLVIPLMQRLGDRLDAMRTTHTVRVDYIVLTGCVAALLAFAAAPRIASGTAGVVATAIIALSAWTLLLGVVIVRLQERRPLDVFRMLEMEATPVLTLAVALVVGVSLSGGDPDLHRIRTIDDENVAVQRHGLAAEFDDWLVRSSGCDRGIDGRTVRPMVLIAASGGGIRAAVWTADTLAQLADTGECGRQVALAASGVSGGSVGLAIVRQTIPASSTGEESNNSSDVVRAAARRLAGPDALSVGLAGTLIGDQVAAATGLRAQLHGGLDTWRDRAGLIEEVWDDEIPELADEYSTGVDGPTGFIVFNSTAAEVKCRVLISQVELGPEQSGKGPNCRDVDGAPPSSIDLADSAKDCFPKMSWSTAAMLSARFPLVTPSGRIVPEHAEGQCDVRSLQMIDGGYSDGEGLATIADIAPALAEVVRVHNDAARQEGGVVVVPLVIYLNDEPGIDTVPQQGKAAPELLVPLIGSGAKSQLVAREAWMQRIGNSLAANTICTGDAGCEQAVETVWTGKVRQGPVVTVAPPVGPNVEVPLGWTLSKASLDHLEGAVGPAGEPCRTGEAGAAVSTGMVELAELLCPR
ncbi:hypothetical protein OG921_06590 [Aldersonia sp. NBC_00410]|uniref:hypothetical protein n=1 Tax=Aldersonia sp. NBC_00410 TaxID=2975954 RepID=UPI0022506FA0|nr:hypothetical protein [Aldersonia sp. NBC_00410]MCX5042834.1 hypothetical protein [Aldersonia sp. NBC_00410]